MIALARDHGLVDTIDMIDLGSGFFSRMSPELRASFDSHVPTYEEYGDAVGRVFAAQFPSGGPWLVLEPGKPIVADAMAFVTRIVGVKRIGERAWIQVAGSVYDVRPTKSARNLPIRHHGPASLSVRGHVVGSTCMEDDVLHRDYEGPAAPGDLFVFENVGAYTNVLRPPFILPAAPIARPRRRRAPHRPPRRYARRRTACLHHQGTARGSVTSGCARSQRCWRCGGWLRVNHR